MSSALRTIDTALALERAGGNHDLARELYQMLQADLPGYMAKIQQLSANGDYTTLLEVVHKLNGSSTYCGVPALREAASTLEDDLKAGIEAAYASGVSQVLEEIKRLQQTPELNL